MNTTYFGDESSPFLGEDAERLIEFLKLHGLKAFLTRDWFAKVQKELGLPLHRIDAAIEFLQACQVLHQRADSGVRSIELYLDKLDQTASAPTPPSKRQETRFLLR